MVKKFATLLSIVLAVGVLNKGIMQFTHLVGNPHLDNPQIQEVMRTDDYVYDYNGNEEVVAFSHLKLAHAVTMKYFDINETPRFTSDKEILDSRIGDCDYTSKFTYSNFLYLVDASDRPELKEYVRMTVGNVSDDNFSNGHTWLEIFNNGSWRVYETMLNDLAESQEINPASIDELVSTGVVLEQSPLTYFRQTSLQIDREGNQVNTLYLTGLVDCQPFIFIEWDDFRELLGL